MVLPWDDVDCRNAVGLPTQEGLISLLDLVVVEPEIPPNTGNLGRLTLGWGTRLIIVGEPSFDLSNDAALKRAGLDYWSEVDLVRFAEWKEFKRQHDGALHLLTKRASQPLAETTLRHQDALVVGSETRGAPEEVRRDPDVRAWTLPMSDQIRSYNVCNAAAMGLYEAHRQLVGSRDPVDRGSAP